MSATAAMRAEYPVRLDGVLSPVKTMQFNVRGFVVHNNTNQTLQVFDDNNRGWTVPPGNTQAFNPPNDMYGWSAGLTAPDTSNGYAAIELYDVRLPVNTNNPVLQEPGTVPVAIQSGSVTILGSPVIQLASGQSLTLTGSPTVTIGNSNLSVSDALAQAYLSALQGLLPQTLQVFSYAGNVGGGPNAEKTYVLPNAVTQFSVAFIPDLISSAGYDGIMWIFYIIGGRRVYVDTKAFYSWQFASYQLNTIPLWTPYREYIPAGATIGVGLDGEGTILLRV